MLAGDFNFPAAPALMKTWSTPPKRASANSAQNDGEKFEQNDGNKVKPGDDHRKRTEQSFVGILLSDVQVACCGGASSFFDLCHEAPKLL